MFRPGSEGTGFLNGKCHGIITRNGQCYTIRTDPNTCNCSNIHLHRQSKKRVKDYKEILDLAHNQYDEESFQKMKKGWKSYWTRGRVFYDNLSASEISDQTCCILI